MHEEALFFYFVFKHPRTRWYTRCIAACAAGYLLSPVQLIPSFIPLIEFLDDFLVLFLAAKAVRRITPSDVLASVTILPVPPKCAEEKNSEQASPMLPSSRL